MALVAVLALPHGELACSDAPRAATAVTALIALALALWLPLESLARATSFLMLPLFVLVNLALVRVKLRIPHPEGVRTYPLWLPLAGIVTTSALVAFQVAGWLG